MKTFEHHFSISLYSILVILACVLSLFGQTPDEPQPLPPNQTFEREMPSPKTDRYTFGLKSNEFFQVRVEQKGIDVQLKLSDDKGNVLATMDSPNGKEGFETLTWVAVNSGSFVLEVISPNEKAEKGNYVIKRQESRTANDKDKRRIAAESDFVDAIKSLNGDKQKSLQKFRKAYKSLDEIGDIEMKKLALEYADSQEMVLVFNDGDALVLEAQKMSVEGQDKSSLEILNASKQKILEADSKYREADKLAQNLFKNHPDFVAKYPRLKPYPWLAKVTQLNVTSFLVLYYQFLQEPEKELEYASLGVKLMEEARMIDVKGSGVKEENQIINQVQALQHLASAMVENKNQQAIKYYEQVLSKYRELKTLKSTSYNKKQEAGYLIIISQLYSYFCNESSKYCNQKTVEYSLQAISINEELNNTEQVVYLYSTISSAYFQLNEVYQSLQASDKALTLAKSISNKELISQALFSQVALFSVLGNRTKTKVLLNEGLKVSLSIPSFTNDIDSPTLPPLERKNRLTREYGRLINIANNYAQLENPQETIKYYLESIKTAQLLNNKSHEAFSLGNIGSVYLSNKDWQNALIYFQKSEELYKEIGEKKQQADRLVDVSYVQVELNNPQAALPLLIEAQQIYSSLGADDSGVTNVFAKTWYALGNRPLGIFYGKKLLDWIIAQKQKLKDFDRQTQQNFVNTFDKPIRRLADWLIEVGKFAQAEQVLRLLKEEEYSGFVRRDANEIGTLNQRMKLDDDEQKVLDKYKLLSDKVSEYGQDFYALEQKSSQLVARGLKLDDKDEKRYQKLGEDLKIARDAFQVFLDKELVKEIGETKKKNIDDQQANRQILGDLGKGTVMLYTVVGENRTRVILTTPTVQIDGKYEIKAEELNKKVFAFRDALKNPQVDPRPLGKELYDILLKPIEKELRASQAKTLLWYLDGTLRYITLAALSPDGTRYLVEDFQNVVLTSKTNNLQNQESGKVQKVLGLGVSVAETIDNPILGKIPFPELPGTKRELFSIVSDENSKNENGILSGKRFIDETFTTENLQNSLRERKFTVVHIASHFYLGSKDATSFLLLGNGKILSLSDIKGSSFIQFGGVDLVTLSACNTGFADNTNGAEVDSLADIIQVQGGKSVLATLWSVADESTSLLMSEFYRIRKSNSKITKAEAIQLAQKEMIEGRLKAENVENQKGMEIVGLPNKTVAPPFPIDKDKPFGHPYYWSPFILIGNWK